MKLLSLTLTKFASFKKAKTLVFPDGPGLFFMTGENELEQRLEANGTGKSTVWNALTWLFFERDLKGRRASDICTWGEKGGTTVTATYKVDGQLYVLTRTWNPNSYTLVVPSGETIDLVKDETNLLHHQLKLSYIMFLNTVIFGQKEPMFLDMAATEKSNLFSSVMNLDYWIVLSDKASAKAAELKAKIETLRNKISSDEGSLSTLKAVDYSSEIRSWDALNKEEIASVENEISFLRKEIRGKTQEASAETRVLEASQLEEAKLKEKLAIAEKDANEKHDYLNHVQSLISKKEGEITAVRRRTNTLDKLEHSCPYCLQDISDKHKERIHAEVEREIQSINKRADSLSAQLSDAQEATFAADKHLAILQDKASNAKSNSREASIKAQQATSRLTAIKESLSKAESNLELLTSAVNPYITLKEKNQTEIQSLETLLEQHNERMEILQHAFQSNTYWVRGFKEVRLFLISETLQQLEIETNSSLTQLGLVDWKILFDVDKENKSGKVQKGFNVLIKSPNNTDAVAWESWSGGESQRLRLAAAMGLSNLIKNRVGATIDMEVWDEPTTSMSQQGVVDFLDKLKERALSENLQIWVIDHTTLGYNQFDGIIKVIKDKNGSSFA